MANTEWTREKIERWIDQRSWYQRIELTNGLVTSGKIDCKARLSLLKNIVFRDRSVLDIGCNSGYYCLWAKKQSAAKVVGVDIDANRIKEGRTLAEIEGLNIEFNVKQMSELMELGQFDFVFCFAVFTEIPDLLGSLNV